MLQDAATSPTYPSATVTIVGYGPMFDGDQEERRPISRKSHHTRTTSSGAATAATTTTTTTTVTPGRPRQYGRRGPPGAQRCCCLMNSCTLIGNGMAGGGGGGGVRTVLLPNSYATIPGSNGCNFEALITSAKESAISNSSRTKKTAAHHQSVGSRLYCCPQYNDSPGSGPRTQLNNNGQTTLSSSQATDHQHQNHLHHQSSKSQESLPGPSLPTPPFPPPPPPPTLTTAQVPLLLDIHYSAEERELFDDELSEHSCFRRSVPSLPMCVAVLFCILNCFLPGLGTFLASLSILIFGCKTEYGSSKWKRAFILCICASVIQMATAIFVLGWVWSIMTGINFIKHSSRERERAMFKKHAYNFNNNHL